VAEHDGTSIVPNSAATADRTHMPRSARARDDAAARRCARLRQLGRQGRAVRRAAHRAVAGFGPAERCSPAASGRRTARGTSPARLAGGRPLRSTSGRRSREAAIGPGRVARCRAAGSIRAGDLLGDRPDRPMAEGRPVGLTVASRRARQASARDGQADPGESDQQPSWPSSRTCERGVE